MQLRIYNKTNVILSYASGAVSIPALSFTDVQPQYFNQIETDPNVRNDLTTNKIDVSDTVVRYGNNDGITYLNYMAGTRDDRGNGITSTASGSHIGLDVNILNGIALSPLPASNVVSVIKYSELPNVASGSLQTILTYTVPAGKRAILQKVLVSGENIAKFQTNYNSSTIATKRTYFQNLNEEFNFVENSNNGFLMQAGDIITITVLQVRPSAANFESSLQVVEIT